MKILRAVILGAMLMFAAPKLSPQDKPEKIEYNLGICGGRGFSVMHAVDQGDKLVFNYVATSPDAKLVEDTDPLIFAITKKETAKGEFNFDGEVKLDETNLEIHGIIRNNRMAALIMADGSLAKVLYGEVGLPADMLVKAKDEFQFCKELHDVDQKKIPDILNDFMDHGTMKAPSQEQ